MIGSRYSDNFRFNGCCSNKIIIVTIVLSCFNIKANESYRFLGIFPHPAVSHFRAFEPLLTELGLRGHDVFVVSHFPNKSAPANYHDFPLDQNEIMTSTLSVDEVSVNIKKLLSLFVSLAKIEIASAFNAFISKM